MLKVPEIFENENFAGRAPRVRSQTFRFFGIKLLIGSNLSNF